MTRALILQSLICPQPAFMFAARLRAANINGRRRAAAFIEIQSAAFDMLDLHRTMKDGRKHLLCEQSGCIRALQNCSSIPKAFVGAKFRGQRSAKP